MKPIPEPERPTITPIRDIEYQADDGDYYTNETIVRRRDAEIIAWLEWEDEVRGKLPFDSIANRLLRELREADKP